MAMPQLFKGWKTITSTLKPQGRRWLVSPWVSHIEPIEASLGKGDRLVLRGEASDFVLGMSSLGVVRKLLELGVEVRCKPSLHAKVYALEAEPGWVFVGSANLSQAGYEGRGHKGNIEAMAGPFFLDPGMLGQLEQLWAASSVLNLEILEQEMQKVIEGKNWISNAPLDLLLVRMAPHQLQGSCTLRAEWLNINTDDPAWSTVAFPSVRFVDPKNAAIKKLKSHFARTVRSWVPNLIQPVSGPLGNSTYVLHPAKRLEVEQRLRELSLQMRVLAQEVVKGKEQTLIADFMQRFELVWEEFSKDSLSNPEVDTTISRTRVLQEARVAVSEYLSVASEGVDYYYLLPLGGSRGQDPFREAAEKLAPQPLLSGLG